MLIIGLTGSIAMGKSEAAKYFATLGIPVFDADAEVHRLYDSKAGVELLKHDIPEAIINHKVDRATLTKLVMQDKSLLERLETKVHAEIGKRRDAFTLKAKQDHHNIVVHDVPLLFEKHLEKNVDIIVIVSSPEHLQRQRALTRPGMTEEKLKMILSRQMPDQEKRAEADYILENDGSLADLHAQIDALLLKVKPRHA